MDRALTVIERCAPRSTVNSCGSCRRCHGACQLVNSVSVLLLATSVRRERSGATSARQRRAALQVDTSPASMGCECLRLLAVCTRCTPATRICCIWVLGTARPITSCCTRPLSALPRHRPTGQQLSVLLLSTSVGRRRYGATSDCQRRTRFWWILTSPRCAARACDRWWCAPGSRQHGQLRTFAT